MVCNCCNTGRCCQGASCSENTKSQCVSNSGTHTEGETCENKTCVSRPPYNSPCEQTNACNCAAKYKDVVNIDPPTCNCAALTAAGVPHGGCQAYYCNACVSGSCALTCASPRQCCAGTCCPESHYCVTTGGYCNPRCNSPNTYCNTSNSNYSFSCCTPSQKCCGIEGCKPRPETSVNVTVTIDVGQDVWVNTGVSVPSNTTVSITATGGAGGGGNTAPINSGPNGVSPTPPESPFSECKVMGSEPLLRLIGEVGGAPFSVGASYSGKPGSGALRLRANSTCTTRFTGSYEAQVQYVNNDPCPYYTPASVGEPIIYGAGGEPVEPSPGPGAALKSLLSLAGIVSSPTCSCNARAAQMDSWGEWESLKRLPEICDWLKEEADKRNMWFFRPAGYALVLAAVLLAALKRAIRGNNK